MVAAYKELGYRLVPSEHKALLKMSYHLGNNPPKGFEPRNQEVYILAWATDKSGNQVQHPMAGVSLLNREKKAA